MTLEVAGAPALSRGQSLLANPQVTEEKSKLREGKGLPQGQAAAEGTGS